MYKLILLLLIFFTLGFVACKESDLIPEEDSKTLVELLKIELKGLPENPLDWKDEDLVFLDEYKDYPMIGLGEATHGTSGFFQAKFRVYRYLVENHGFKNFIFEADFSESIFIDQAIQESRTSDIAELMKTKMHFWIWKNSEVLQLLEWMSEYNIGKSDDEKLHYLGNDVQYNTYQNFFINSYFLDTEIGFSGVAASRLSEVQEAFNKEEEKFDPDLYDSHYQYIEDLQDSMLLYKDYLVAKKSLKEYELHYKLLENILQSMENGLYRNTDLGHYVRDEYMASNSIWLKEHFGDVKSVLWAHNGHMSKSLGRQGAYIDMSLSGDYVNLAFVFAEGEFYAREFIEMGGFTGFLVQKVNSPPKLNSINHLFYQTEENAFVVKTKNLLQYPLWNMVYESGIDMLNIGAVFDESQANLFYTPIRKGEFDLMIYLKESIKSDSLQ